MYQSKNSRIQIIHFAHPEKSHCVSNPCSNGAHCIEVRADIDNPQGSYKCGCKDGFTGDHCDGKIPYW